MNKNNEKSDDKIGIQIQDHIVIKDKKTDKVLVNRRG